MNQTDKLHLPYLYQTAHTSVKDNPLEIHFFENLPKYWAFLLDGTIQIPLQNRPIFM